MNNQVLVVDNHHMLLEFLSELLGKNGYEVNTAENGLKALDILESFRPDVIFIDLIMPHLGGEQLCRIIRNKFKKEDFSPVLIVISATAKEEIGDHGVPDFADIFIAKGPFSKMGGHVLKTLETLKEKGIQDLSSRVIGIEDVYHREITRELLIIKNHQELVLSSMTDGFLELTADLTIVYANSAAARYLGVPEGELISKHFPEIVPEIDFEKYPEKQIYRNGRYLSITAVLTDDNDYPSHLVILHDDSERITAELALKEKDLLLHELHHRVKNNLTMLTSLISLQKDYVENNQELYHLDRLHHRIHSVSLSYHTLMTQGNIAVIDFEEYARQLAEDILRTMMLPKNQIVTKIESEKFSFEIETMIPLGLLITELFTNAVQHGYPLETQIAKPAVGTITIGLKKEKGKYVLSVNNDGVPFPKDVDFMNSNSLGLRLACVLTEQLEGTITLNQTGETSFTISFPIPQ